MYLLYTSYSSSGRHAPPWCLHRLIVLFKVILTTEKPFVILALIGITSQIIFLPSTLCYTDNSLQLLQRVQTTERKLWSFTGCNINSLVSNSQRDNLRQFCRTKKHKQKWYLLSFFDDSKTFLLEVKFCFLWPHLREILLTVCTACSDVVF